MAPDSKMETFAALRLEINSWRWQGVPIYIRAGKNLPITCSEVFVKFCRPPMTYSSANLVPNYLRFRLNPDITIALGLVIPVAGEQQPPDMTRRARFRPSRLM